MFAGAARAPFVNDLLFSRWKPYDRVRAVFRYAVVNLRKKLCVTQLRRLARKCCLGAAIIIDGHRMDI